MKKCLNLRPGAIIAALDLRRPIYPKKRLPTVILGVSCQNSPGRETDKVADLRQACRIRRCLITMRLASVILDIPTQALEGAYAYIVPPALSNVEVGCAVLVPFGSRQVIGYVVAREEILNVEAHFATHNLDASVLKEVQQVLSSPYFDSTGARCAQFLSETYIAPLSSCIRLFMPPGGVPRMVRSGSGWRVEDSSIGPVDDRWVRLKEGTDFKPIRSAVKQRAIIEALRAGDLRVAGTECGIRKCLGCFECA